MKQYHSILTFVPSIYLTFDSLHTCNSYWCTLYTLLSYSKGKIKIYSIVLEFMIYYYYYYLIYDKGMCLAVLHRKAFWIHVWIEFIFCPSRICCRKKNRYFKETELLNYLQSNVITKSVVTNTDNLDNDVRIFLCR